MKFGVAFLQFEGFGVANNQFSLNFNTKVDKLDKYVSFSTILKGKYEIANF